MFMTNSGEYDLNDQVIYSLSFISSHRCWYDKQSICHSIQKCTLFVAQFWHSFISEIALNAFLSSGLEPVGDKERQKEIFIGYGW